MTSTICPDCEQYINCPSCDDWICWACGADLERTRLTATTNKRQLEYKDKGRR